MKALNLKNFEDAKQNILEKLRNDVYPQVMRQIDINLKQEMNKQSIHIKKSVRDELKNQKDMLDKAMEDVRQQMNTEREQKENQDAAIKNALERIEEIKDGLQE
jgi:hypothetical protein